MIKDFDIVTIRSGEIGMVITYDHEQIIIFKEPQGRCSMASMDAYKVDLKCTYEKDMDIMKVERPTCECSAFEYLLGFEDYVCELVFERCG